MILGFHYHIPFSEYNGEYYVPAHFGLFLDEIANNVENLRLFLFKREQFDSNFFDHKLSVTNITIIQVSLERSAYLKYFLAKIFIGAVSKELKKCDYLLLRGPSPANYAFSSYFNPERITNLMVGDYLEGNKHIKQPFYRLAAVKLLNYAMHKSYVKSITGTKICFNSELLYNNYNNLASKSKLINTGNIKLSDISKEKRLNLFSKKVIRLLYVGRIDWAKGFNEMLESLENLNSHGGKKYILDIVGWDESKGEKVLKQIIHLIESKGLINLVTFHGKKRPGKDLNFFYRNSDIFILPSYQEGFPRTIWEAFANGLPVVSTPVGAIKYKLVNRKHALFCDVKSSRSLSDRIKEITMDSDLMNCCIENGYLLVEDNTIEIQVEKLISFIQNDQ